jgi:hypothetical protein
VRPTDPAVPVGILRKILLVIVGAEAGISAKTTELSLRRPSTGRLPVDVVVVPAVDGRAIPGSRSQRNPTRYSRISFTVQVESRLRFNCSSKRSLLTLT